MKKYIVIACSLLLLVACTAQYKVTYEFPDTLPESIKTRYFQECNQGKVLYEKNCARCHNTIIKRQSVIPDFKQEKLVSYAVRTANKKHESNMPEAIVSEKDLELIMTFLTYKKKNSAVK